MTVPRPASPCFALAAQTSDAADLPTSGVVDGLDPPTGSLAGDVLVPHVGALALAPSNADGGVEEGAEGDAAAASPALPRDFDLSLAGESENQGFPATPDRARQSGGPPLEVGGRYGLAPQLVP